MNSVRERRCTWRVEPKYDPEKHDSPPQPYECGQRAVVVFSILNNNRRHPTEPQRHEYPRCTRHDTDLARQTAVKDGYLIEEIEPEDDA